MMSLQMWISILWERWVEKGCGSALWTVNPDQFLHATALMKDFYHKSLRQFQRGKKSIWKQSVVKAQYHWCFKSLWTIFVLNASTTRTSDPLFEMTISPPVYRVKKTRLNNYSFVTTEYIFKPHLKSVLLAVCHAGGRAAFINVGAFHTDLELISQADSSCRPVDLYCRTWCVGADSNDWLC